MASVGIFFGSDTGNTEHVAKMIQKELVKSLWLYTTLQKALKKRLQSSI